MSEQPHYEHFNEKQEEKEQEKVNEKDAEKRGEKSWDEKWRRDPLSAGVWACVLIWAGIALLLDSLGLLAGLGSAAAWHLILAGAGVILIVEVIIRLLVPAYRRSIVGTLILALVLLAVGTGNLLGAPITWPIILIAVGLALLLRGLLKSH